MGFCESVEYHETRSLKTGHCKLTRSTSSSSSKTSSISEDTIRKYIDRIFEKYDTKGENYIQRSKVKELMTEIAYKQRKKIS